MLTRDCLPEDFDRIIEFHNASGNDFYLHALDSPLFVVRKVAIRDGEVVGACFLRMTAESFLWLDPKDSPCDRFETIKELDQQTAKSAWRLGLDDINARCSPETTKRFSKRLLQLGWHQSRPGWSAWSRRVDERFNNSE